MSLTNRFQDQNLILWNFYSHILVKCPNCEKRAEVITDLHTYHTKLICPNCLYQHTSDNKQTDLLLNVYCLTCSTRLLVKQYNIKHKVQALKVACPECGNAHAYQPKYKEYTRISWNKEGYDPFLGMELWLQTHFKSHLLWALNYDHLAYMENYIAAKLRERNNRKHITMVEKLPLFIKLAKNREGLLKTIEGLKSK